MRRFCAVLIFVSVFVAVAAAAEYKPSGEHQGGDVTPSQAFEMLKNDPAHTFLIDVRTPEEFEFIGHPTMAYNIPFKVWGGKFNAEKKEYVKNVNPNFAHDLLAKCDPQTDTLIIMCRSGHRSVAASTEAVKAGFDAARVFNMMGGFEGNLVDDKRLSDGWRNENLPCTYGIDPKFVYAPDLVAAAPPAPASLSVK